MKTYEQLMKHYWGKIVPMAEAAGINPWECVRCATTLTGHPNIGNLDNYTFAITVLEGRPVFIGDTLYTKTGLPFTVTKGDLVGESSAWTPPTKKRTFMLELDETELMVCLNILKKTIFTGTVESIYKKLTSARDKE